MERINNYNVYINGMRKSLEDKLFWYDLIQDYDTVVDFGCADGSLLKEVERRSAERGLKKKLIGIDNNEEMRERAAQKVPEGYFLSELEKFYATDYAVLNLSSVIHEVYSYCTINEIQAFWYNVFNRNYRYIVIRDMMVSKSICYDKEGRNYNKFIPDEYRDQYKDFYNKRGDVSEKLALEFLLKYRYVENWERESRENYFPIYLEELLEKIPVKYELMYLDHFILPYAKQKVKEDMNIDIVDNTHCKIILKRIEI